MLLDAMSLKSCFPLGSLPLLVNSRQVPTVTKRGTFPNSYLDAEQVGLAASDLCQNVVTKR